jgi:hypothetical protein
MFGISESLRRSEQKILVGSDATAAIISSIRVVIPLINVGQVTSADVAKYPLICWILTNRTNLDNWDHVPVAKLGTELVHFMRYNPHRLL